MSLVGRGLKRSSQPKDGLSSLGDDEPIGPDQRFDANDAATGKQGVLLQDLLGVDPLAFKPDLDWAPLGHAGTQAASPSDDDGGVFENAAELEVGQWPAANLPVSLPEPTSESSQASGVSEPPPEAVTQDADSVMLTGTRWPAWVSARPRLLLLVGIATIVLGVAGGIIIFSRPGDGATPPSSGPGPTAERSPVMRSAVSAEGSAALDVDAPKPNAEVTPKVEAPAGLAAPVDEVKVGARDLARADVGNVVTKSSPRVRADQRPRPWAPRSSANLARGGRSRDGAPAVRARPATGAALALYNEGARLQKAGTRDDAIAAYVRALDEDPSLIEAHNNLAVLRMHSGDPRGAERSLRAAIELNSRYGPAYANLGRLYIQQRRTDEAEIMLLRAARLMPSNASVRNNLALLYQMLGREEDEANAWRSALALGSDDPAVHYNLAVHYQRLGEPTLARLHFHKALAPESQLSPAYRDSARRALESLKAQ